MGGGRGDTVPAELLAAGPGANFVIAAVSSAFVLDTDGHTAALLRGNFVFSRESKIHERARGGQGRHSTTLHICIPKNGRIQRLALL